MTKLLLYRNNCKASKQILDIIELKKDNDLTLVCLDKLSNNKSRIINEKYKIREIPCIVTSDKVMYSSEMFSYVKKSEKNENEFFTGYDGGGMFSQKFSSISQEDPNVQEQFYYIQGISGPNVVDDGKAPKKGKGKKSSSEVDRRFEEMVESRNREKEVSEKNLHNDRVDFSKPISKF